MDKTELAPIVLFVYNRPEHTVRTIEALKNNELADLSTLIIYSDGPKNSLAEDKVRQVRDYIKTVRGFRSVEVVERDMNWGLASSIIDGVSSVINQYGKVIVLEDDIVTSSSFLSFMNKALDFFKLEKKVWHISGWNYPMSEVGLGDVFLWRLMNCWGWATWADRWGKYNKSSEVLKNFSKDEIFRFNIDGVENFWQQIQLNKAGKIDTWAIFWYATIFKHSGLCLNPTKTLVDNIGLDGTGTHCGKIDSTSARASNLYIEQFDIKLEENSIAVQRFKDLHKVSKENIFTWSIYQLKRCVRWILN